MPVDSPHPLASRYQHVFEEIDDVLDGPVAVKSPERAERYLPRLPGMEKYTQEVSPDGTRINRYVGYLKRAVLLPYARPLLNRLTGMVFRKAPVFVLPAGLESLLTDLTLSGLTAEGFAKTAVRENIAKGFGGILVDFSKQRNRPFVRLYGARAICNWDESPPEEGAMVPIEVRLLETVTEQSRSDQWRKVQIPQCRVVSLVPDESLNSKDYPHGKCVQQLFRKEVDENGIAKPEWLAYGEPIIPTRRGKPLGFFPFIPFTPHSVTFDLGRSPFADIIELILAHYLNSADHEHAMHNEAAGAVLFGSGISKEEQATFTAVGGGALFLTENPGAELAYVQAGEAGKALSDAMTQKEGWMAIAMGRLLLAQQKNVAESGRSQEMQFAGDDANLQQIVGTTGMALERAMQIVAWWAGTAATPEEAGAPEKAAENAGPTDAKPTKRVSVELNDQYITGKITPDDVNKLGAEVEKGRMSLRQFFHQVFVLGELGIADQTFEQWKEQLDEDAKDRAAKAPKIVPPPRQSAAKLAAFLAEQQAAKDPGALQ